MAGPLLADAKWVRQAFIVGADKTGNPNLDATSTLNRSYSTASNKFVDTTPGGNIPINPPPQFTRHADPKVPGTLSGSLGLGRYYSEAIDDHSQIVHFRMGVPQFNSLTTFFAGFYNSGAGQLARTGRSTGAFYTLGKAVGFVVPLMSWKLLAVGLLGAGVRFALNKPSSKYYYLKPTMPLYWNAVQTIVNHLAVNRGIVPRLGGKEQSLLDDGYQFDAAGLALLHKLLPDIFTAGGGIDVYALANRAQRLADKRQEALQAAADSADSSTIEDRLAKVNASLLTDTRPAFTTGDPSKPGYLEKWLATAAAATKSTSGGSSDGSTASTSGGSGAAAPASPSDGTVEAFDQTEIADPKFSDFFKAELNDGSAFASFRVNYTGHMQESFSSSTADSELKNKINSMSSQSRSTNFDMAGGNLVGGALGSVVSGILGAVTDTARGVMDGLGISGIAVAGGAAFVDIPQHWESSTAQLAHANYTINLVSPYGNPISQLINLDIPLAMLLAMVLPLSTGKQSHSAPFILEYYDQGRCQSRLAVIDSMSITRGTGNLGFNKEGHAMGIDVSFGVKDLSSVVHMPIAEGISLLGAAAEAATSAVVSTGASAVTDSKTADTAGGAAGAFVGQIVDGAVFDDDNLFTDYMAVISGMGLADQIYSFRKLTLSLTKRETDFKSFVSTDHFGQWLGDTWPARLWSAKYKGLSE